MSYFKNFHVHGRSYKNEYVLNKINEIGANSIELEDGNVGFNIMVKTYGTEQINAMMFTKVRHSEE